MRAVRIHGLLHSHFYIITKPRSSLPGTPFSATCNVQFYGQIQTFSSLVHSTVYAFVIQNLDNIYIWSIAIGSNIYSWLIKIRLRENISNVLNVYVDVDIALD